ncbi:MAG: hypothetical protein UR66_C0009G0099 [Candidatus Moranbacteria bacterium GW2011_GWE1_35_17]|nr:MAG: hypothetical protein UR65_C0077G0005 [Candidatus Moranbacteria bacterium GW2011_GWE2_35_164]KKP68009.1 MAG: hypothetical protein UR66_C0009G0099 [Candidatus Moranbacteria bacterium GW2011_GWE1_35_17]KKP82301.1 MAG: hypothetical protein UR82_C0040G0010 [Candidatus Moranbacteria bacterium GW2011_GWF1_35_5]KKP82438.1 MAG: hypothetical protein UR83_C0052G0009 [Candidatus Moranbacteria bacterium GW2011_GWF2_35_54]
MADKDSKKKDDSSKESPAKNMAKAEKFVESLQFIGILGAIIMGLRQPPKPGEAVVGDKQVPNWLLSAFPSLTAEDEVEFNLILSSLSTAKKNALKMFEFLLKQEGIFDEVKFRVLLVKIRREFIEKMRTPVPENKSQTLTFGKLKVNDAVSDFAASLAKENVAGITPEQVFENQKLIADNMKLIEKKSFLKKLSENKAATILWALFVVTAILAILKKIIS